MLFSQHCFRFRTTLFSFYNRRFPMFFSCIKLDTNISNCLIRVLNSICSSHTELLFRRLSCILSQLKTLASAQTNQARSKRKHYFCNCGINFTHRRKNCSSNKAVHQYEAYYKKRMGVSEKGCEWWLGAIFNKIEISKPKISWINYINTPPNPNITNILAITDSGANIHLARQATPTMYPVIMEN